MQMLCQPSVFVFLATMNLVGGPHFCCVVVTKLFENVVTFAINEWVKQPMTCRKTKKEWQRCKRH